MSRERLPEREIVTCDVCRKPDTEAPRLTGSVLNLQRFAVEGHVKIADATVTRDLCDNCADVVATAVNDAASGKGRGVPDKAVCFFVDGDKWCATFGDFVNLQESPAGFGESFDEALKSLEVARQEQLRLEDAS